MKHLPLIMLLMLAGCDGLPGEAAMPGAGERVACAVGGAEAFERVCVLEREQGADGVSLTLRHPDGGFRRLRLTSDGLGVVAADGSEPAHVTIVKDGEVEVAVAADRYRLLLAGKGLAAQ